MFKSTLQRREIHAMARAFSVSTGRIGSILRMGLVVLVGVVLILAAPPYALRIAIQLAVPFAGAAAAWLHAYEDYMRKIARLHLPLLSAVARHLLKVGGTPIPSLAGVLEVGGAVSMLLLIAGPWSVPAPSWAVVAAAAMVLAFSWSVGRGVMLDSAWYNQDSPAAGPIRLFRYIFPGLASVIFFVAFLTTATPALPDHVGRITCALVTAAVLATLYPLTLNYEHALTAADEAVKYRVNVLRREGARDVHSLVKNPLHLLRSELESSAVGVGFYVQHFLDEVRLGVEEAVRAVEDGTDAGDVPLEDLARYLNQMLSSRHRNMVCFGEATNVRTVSARDYGATRAAILDFVTNAVKAGAQNVVVDVQRLDTTPVRMRVSVKDDAPGQVYLSAEPNARSSLAALRELLRDMGAGDVRLDKVALRAWPGCCYRLSTVCDRVLLRGVVAGPGFA